MSESPKAPVNLPDDVLALSYEQARDELMYVVDQLERGQGQLEESLALWQRGEHLATHCQRWLDGAKQQLDAALANREN